MEVIKTTTETKSEDNRNLAIRRIAGTLLQSVTFGHILHFQSPMYSSHEALDDYYKEMPELIDKLVESWQGSNEIIRGYENGVPYVKCPIEYLTKVKNLVEKYKMAFNQESQSNYVSLIDDTIDLLNKTLYKLMKLNEAVPLNSKDDDKQKKDI